MERKKNPTNWGKIVANDAPNMGLISKVQKYLIQLNIKNKTKAQPNQKMGRRPKQTFLQRKYTVDKHAHEKMLSVTNYQRNANQSYNAPHSHLNGYHQNVYK